MRKERALNRKDRPKPCFEQTGIEKSRTSCREQGSILLGVTILIIVAAAFVAASFASANNKIRAAQSGETEIAARYIAEAGLQLQLASLRSLRDLASLDSPFAGIDAIDTNLAIGGGSFAQTYSTEPIVDSTGATVGEIDVVVDVTDRSEANRREIAITSVGYVPTKAAFEAGVRSTARIAVRAVVEVRCDQAEVFDYSYFINHWGWLYGNSIVANGNVRANGQFDFGGYGPTMNGTPRYEDASGADLIGYLDDNEDGITDGSDGGVYAGWGIVDADNVTGMGGLSENKHDWQENLPMPNLSELGVYEQLAVSKSGTISVGGSVVAAGVVGDDPGEAQNLFLVGTVADPVVLNGPVVVRGDVVISGVVTGQGSIYSGRNAYVPDDLTYAAGPSPKIPSATDEATVEAWRSSNTGTDALGLFAREHVVIGDYTDSRWQSNVGSWISHSMNESAEDAGIDGIQNTAAGRDGILGTSDDDVLENDGTWTVETYTAAHAALGAIPAGSAVGDPIPGTGEDIDGDGQYDGTFQLSEFDVGASIGDASQWEGNLPAGTSSFSDVSDVNIAEINASFYTNHAFAALMLNWGGDIEINGSIVCRNESIIAGANQVRLNHDPRMLAGEAASFGVFMPLTWQPISMLQWTVVEASTIEAYLTGNVSP